MALRPRRHRVRNAMILVASTLAHVLVLYLLASEIVPQYQLPVQEEPPAPVELVPMITPPPPPPPPLPKLKPLPKPEKKPAPAPQPQPQPQPEPSKPQIVAPPKPAPQPVPKPTAPTKPALNPTPAPAPKPTPKPVAPLAPTVAAPNPGPPKPAPQAPVITAAPTTITAPTLRLHRSENQSSTIVAPPVSVPGGVFAPPASAAAGNPPGAGGPPGAASGPGGGANGSANSGILPYGPLPNGFGRGLRGSTIGCANADAVRLNAEERAHCAQAFGTGTREAPVMDPIGATRRTGIDDEASRQQAKNRYRDAVPTGTSSEGAIEPGLPPASVTPKVSDTIKGQ
ncbi:MAG: hypothetical protein ACHP84_12735 [Caulobacterales bacterium]